MTATEYDGLGLVGCPACTGPTKGSSTITKITDAEGKVTYIKYDGLDRQIQQIRKEGDVADVIDASDAVTVMTYDANSNELTTTEPNGNTTTYVYDALNRRTSDTNAAGDPPVLKRLRAIDPETMTPKEALNLLFELNQESRSGEDG